MPSSTQYDDLEVICSGFQEMTKREMVIAPWLILTRQNERLTDVQRTTIEDTAEKLAEKYNQVGIRWPLRMDVSLECREHAYRETLLSTAAYLSYMRLGTLIITDEMVSVAERLLTDILENGGEQTLLALYARTVVYLNCQLLRHYGKVPVEVFLSGEWHRPWIEYSLDHELEQGILHGFVERIYEEGQSYVTLTPAGEDLYQSCRDHLERCGYVRQREQLMRVASFTSMDDYESIIEHIVPDVHSRRRSILEWGGISRGMHVLELGCGAGALTLDDGLSEVVGPEGKVIASDPAIGMLSRAKEKHERFDAPNVQFCQASAEKIPFPDNTFDAVTGSLFLHFTDIPKALEEIHRVLKPGGIFATLYSLDLSRPDFFVEWFDPIFRLGLAPDRPSAWPSKDLVPSLAGNYFEPFDCPTCTVDLDFSNVEEIVKFLVEAGTLAELHELPWKARHQLFDELVERGHQVKRRYGAERMRVPQPKQRFRGVAKK